MTPRHLLAAVLALLCACSQAAEYWTWSQPAAHHAAVVRIRDEQPDGSVNYGTGCYVRHETITGVLTAAHCLRGRSQQITWSDGTITEAEQPTIDRDGADVGLVPLAHPTIPPLTLRDTGPTPSERLEFCGWGGPGVRLRHYYGQLAGRRDRDAVYTPPVLSGDSGGPILDSAGRVVGVISWGDRELTRIAGAAIYESQGGVAHQPMLAFVQRCQQRYGGVWIGAGGFRGGCSPGSCGPGGCPAPPPRPRPSEPPVVPLPKLTPPETTPPPAPASPAIDSQRIAEILLARLAADPRFRGPPGPAGPAGPEGPVGQAATIDYSALASEMLSRLPPITVETYTADGRLVETESYPVGTPIRLRYGRVPTAPSK